MNFHSLFSFLKPRSAPATKRPSNKRRPHLRRLQIESLEDRTLLSTFFAYNLGTLGGSGSQLTDINVHGQVVGLSATDAGGPSQGVEHAFVWDRGTMIDLGSLDGPTSDSSAWGINDSGQVAGISYRLDPNGFSRPRGFLVTPEDTDGNGQPDRWYRDNDSNGINDLMRDLGTLGGDSAYATGVNNAGQVVGMANTADGGLYAFRWQNGQMTSLGSLGGSTNRWSYGYGINDSGQVVGVSSASNSTPAFQWDSARGLTNLGTLPGHDHGIAFDITNSGVVAGTSGSYEASRAVTWTPSTPNGVPGSAVSLGTLPGDTASEAFDINNSGQVVGLSHTYVQDQEGHWYRPASRPVRWQGGGVIALADLMPAGSGWYFRSVSAINDAGQMVGGGGRAGDYGDGFLMSPTDLGLPLLSIGDVTITEGNGGVSNAVFTVTLSAASSNIVSATYAAAPVPFSAVQNLDYVASSGTVTFNPGETSRTITVPVYADTLDESDEMFVVNLSRTTNAAIADGQATGTIDDDDAVPTLHVNDIVVVEGNSGTSDAVFTVSLSPAADRERTVSFQTEGYNDEYYYSDDFEGFGGDLTFAPGETTKSVTVRVYGDTIPEPDETFRVFATYQGATSLSDEGTATIRNDEPVIPMPDVSDPTLVEGAGTTNAVFTVTLVMGPLAAPATFTYQTANGSAEAGSDYAAANGTITFAPGETEKTIAVPVYGDDRYEVNESFSLLVSNPTQLPYTQDTGYATITNDDPLPTVSVSDVAAPEGNTGTTEFVFTVSLSAPSGVPLGYYFASEQWSAGYDDDFQYVSGFVGFNPGETTRTVVVSVIGDLLFEADETFFVQLYDWPWYEEYPIPITDAFGTGTILNDDSNLPLVTIGDVAVSEGNTGTRSAVFTVSLSAPSSQSVTVNFSTANGTAGASDYQANTGTLTFAPGQTSRTIIVLVSGDRVGEPNETFFVNLSSPTNATIADGQGVGTIADDEPRISISDATKKEGKKGQTTQFTFTVTLSAAYDQAVTTSYSTANGTATTSDSDYVARTGTLTFAPGETTKTITIEVKGDSKREANETFYLDLFGISSNALFTKTRGIGTILNDD